MRNSSDHGLPASLVDVPGVDAACGNFRDGPGEGVPADALGERASAFMSKLLRIVEADDAAFRIEHDRAGDDGTKKRPAAHFVDTGDSLPTALARLAFIT